MAKFIPRSLLRYSAPLAASIFIFVGLEILLILPNLLFFIAAVLFFIHILAIWQLIPKTTEARLILNSRKGKSLKIIITFLKIITDQEFINFLLPSLLLNASAFVFIIFLPESLLRHLAILLISILSFLFFKNIFLYFYRPEEYQAHSLENISLPLSLMTLYFFSAGFLGLIIFADFLLWQALLAYLAVVFLLARQIFWIYKFEIKISWLFVFVLCLVMGEFFWAINFLPLNFYVNGLILAVVYYLFFSLSRRWLKGDLEKKIIWQYLIFSLLIIIIILATAEWK